MKKNDSDWIRKSKLLKCGRWIAGSFMAFVKIRLRKAGWVVTETVVYDTVLLKDYPSLLLPLPPLKIGHPKEKAIENAELWIRRAAKMVADRGRVICG